MPNTKNKKRNSWGESNRIKLLTGKKGFIKRLCLTVMSWTFWGLVKFCYNCLDPIWQVYEGLELHIRIDSTKSLPLLSYLGNHMIVGGPRGWVPIPAFNIVLPAIVRMRHLILGLIASGFEMNFRFCGDYT